MIGTVWSAQQLDRITATEEVQVTTTTRRGDGSLRAWVPVWIVRVGDDAVVRSFHGADGAWYRHATSRGEARIRIDRTESDVSVVPIDDARELDAVDDAYRAKYARYGQSYLQPMLAPAARAATLRLAPTTSQSTLASPAESTPFPRKETSCEE